MCSFYLDSRVLIEDVQAIKKDKVITRIEWGIKRWRGDKTEKRHTPHYCGMCRGYAAFTDFIIIVIIRPAAGDNII